MDKWTETAVKAAAEKKGEDIRIYDVQTLSPFLDTMVIVSTANLRMNNSIVQNIKDRLKEAGFNGDIRIEGRADSRWQLVDLGNAVIHVFVRDEREYYGLDKLYGDVYAGRWDL